MILPNSANIVALASNYNPSIVSKEWLYRKGIFTDTVKNFVHTPVFALVESQDFSIVVDEERLQITAKKVTQSNLTALANIAEKFVGILPETPYKGVGLNYRYLFPIEDYDLHNILSPNNAKLSKLLSPTYKLGATVVFEFEKFIVTFIVSPSVAKEQQIQMSFNFHSNIANAGEVKERLSAQMRTFEKTQKIIQGLSKNG
jgi:hypothetical protein